MNELNTYENCCRCGREREGKYIHDVCGCTVSDSRALCAQPPFLRCCPLLCAIECYGCTSANNSNQIQANVGFYNNGWKEAVLSNWRFPFALLPIPQRYAACYRVGQHRQVPKCWFQDTKYSTVSHFYDTLFLRQSTRFFGALGLVA